MTIMQTIMLRTEAAAKRIGRSPKTLRNWRAVGDGPPYSRSRGLVLYERDTLDQWANAVLGFVPPEVDEAAGEGSPEDGTTEDGRGRFQE